MALVSKYKFITISMSYIMLIYLVFAVIPECLMFSPLPTGGWDWLGFVGILFAAIIALIGVSMTIESENENNRTLQKIENNRMRQQQQMAVIPYLDVNLHKALNSGSENNIFRVFMEQQNKLVNDGYIIRKGNSTPDDFTVSCNINVRNLGLSTAFSIETFIYKINEVEGLKSLDDIATEKRREIIENFYDKIRTCNYEYIEGEQTYNNEWQLYTTFNLTNDIRSHINLVFDLGDIENKFHNILEFRFNDIYENQYHQLLYLYFGRNRVAIMPISKIYKGKSHIS